MPRYEFECKKCSEVFAVMVPYAEKKKTCCPACGGDELQERYGLALGSSGDSGKGSSGSPFS
jgi:putative FmdB family regulatory protein